MIKTEIVGHSLSPQGDELISVLCTFPRIILAEVNTHRMLSKNTSSSRAIPFEKMVESVQNDPFVPIAWQKDHKGMQGTEYLVDRKHENAVYEWLKARDFAVKQANIMNSDGVTKQLANRLLEPFMWTTMLITGSKEGWDNFFELRCPQYHLENVPTVNEDLSLNAKTITIVGKSKKELLKQIDEIDNDSYTGFKNIINKYSDLDWLQINKGQAEIHMMALAEEIYDAVNESTPKQLKAGEWHIPFEDKIHIDGIQGIQFTLKGGSTEYHEAKWTTEAKIKISTAMAAHTSYTIVGGEAVKSYEKWIELHDKLIAYNPPHSSPMEHCCICVTDEDYNKSFKGEEKGWFRNYKGFKSYRQIIEESK